MQDKVLEKVFVPNQNQKTWEIMGILATLHVGLEVGVNRPNAYYLSKDQAKKHGKKGTVRISVTRDNVVQCFNVIATPAEYLGDDSTNHIKTEFRIYYDRATRGLPVLNRLKEIIHNIEKQITSVLTYIEKKRQRESETREHFLDVTTTLYPRPDSIKFEGDKMIMTYSWLLVTITTQGSVIVELKNNIQNYRIGNESYNRVETALKSRGREVDAIVNQLSAAWPKGSKVWD